MTYIYCWYLIQRTAGFTTHVTVAINENHLSFMLLPTANLLSVFKSRCIFVVVVLSLFKPNSPSSSHCVLSW